MKDKEIEELYNLALGQLLKFNIDSDCFASFAIVNKYLLKIFYENYDKSLVCHNENIKTFNKLLIRDIKNGYPYAIDIYYYYYYTIQLTSNEINKIKDNIVDYIFEGYECADIIGRKLIIKFIRSRNDLERLTLKLIDRDNNLESKIYDLEKKIYNLEKENSILKAHIEYMPDGSGYKEAEKHFLQNINKYIDNL